MSMTSYPEALHLGITHELQAGLSHPADRRRFIEAATMPMSPDELTNLERRYPPEMVGEIVIALELNTVKDAIRRQNFELQNAGHLLWESPNAAQYTQKYNDLAGNIGRQLDYIRFFSQVTNDFFAREEIAPPAREVIQEHIAELGITHPEKSITRVSRLALELLGCFQRGDWEGTASVDDPMRQLREQLIADPRFGYRELETPGQKQITYRFEKLPDNVAGEGHAYG